MREKNTLVKQLTFSVLKYISADNESNKSLVEKVEQLTALYDTEIYINYKTKETANYKVDISYQIKPANASTQAIVNYRDKKDIPAVAFCEGGQPAKTGSKSATYKV